MNTLKNEILATQQNPINLYHRWVYFDEIEQAINCNINSLSQELKISAIAIKIIRMLGFLEGISYSILNSFCHPNHPAQIDDHKKLKWMQSFVENLDRWHAIYHGLLKEYASSSVIPDSKKTTHTIRLHPDFNQEPFAAKKKTLKKILLQWNKKHAALFFETDTLKNWQQLQTVLIDPSFVSTITTDSSLDPVKNKYAHIEPFFRGIHQMLEVAMHAVLDITEQLQSDIAQLKVSPTCSGLEATEYEHIVMLRTKMGHLQRWWEAAATHIMLLNQMDTGSYAEYRQALLGTSGGDSKQLRQLKSIMTKLHFYLPAELNKQSIIDALQKDSADPLLNQLISAIRELQAISTDFWLRHFTLTANTIGLLRGSQGLPVEKLLSFALNPIMSKESLLQLVGQVGRDYAQLPEAVVVRMPDQREKIIGNTIYSHVKNDLPMIREYRVVNFQQEPLLDDLELRPIEPNDTHSSPYASWFNPDLHTQEIRFEMHSFGEPCILLQDSITRTTQRVMESQNDYWKTFFLERLTQFQAILFKLLEIENNTNIGVSIDANVTAFLERILSALSLKEDFTILTTDQEFLAVQRVLAAMTVDSDITLEKIKIDFQSLNLAESFQKAIQRIGGKLKLVVFSQVMSNSQISLTPDEIKLIIESVPQDIPIIIDITQGVFNVPFAWGDLLKDRCNVYLVGSAIKHGRSTTGLGFLIHPNPGLLQHPKKSGWCAYLSGLSAGRTLDDDGHLLYDDAFQWLGGTPSNLFSVDIFINTWDAILRSGETLRSLYHYVQSLQQYFLASLRDKNIIVDQKRRENFPQFSSNALVLSLPSQKAKDLVEQLAKNQIYCDYRVNYGVRLGFGIQHSKGDIDRLCALIGDL